MIVSVDDYSFEQAKERNFYACPASYGRGDKGEYVAFYQNSPRSAITHYAKIKEVFEDHGEFLNSKDKLMMLPGLGNNHATVFKLEEVKELEEPIENNISGGVQGSWYVKMEELKEATELSNIQK